MTKNSVKTSKTNPKGSKPNPNDPKTKEIESKNGVKDSVNRFGFELFKVFNSRHKNDYKNMCFSPFAIFNSLAMILCGAEKFSEKQLASVLHLQDIKKDPKVLTELRELMESVIKSNHEIILAIRFLYINKDIELKTDYKKLLKEYFAVKAKKVDFSDIENTSNIINKDSKDSTDGVIDDVIAKKDISGENKNVKLILMNSLLFRGFWASSFDEEFKTIFKFGKNNELSAEIQMMRHLGFYRCMFSQHLKAYIVSIPYVTSDLRMIVILPDEPKSDGIYLIEYLNKDLFESIMNTLQSMEKKKPIQVSIPRFALDAQQMSVQRTIKQMGAIDIFDETLADLSAMSENRIHLTKLVHKSFILVDERGSALGDPRIKRRQSYGEVIEKIQPLVFVANHPFVFIIADKVTNVAIFMGYFGDPREMLEVVRESDLTPEQIHELLTSTQ